MSEDFNANHQLVSALADGELRGDEFGQALDLLGHSEQALAAWRSYHVVGDALRGADFAITHREQAFVARLRSRLDGVAIFPVHAGTDAQPLAPLADADLPSADLAANDPARRWKWLAAAASVAAVAAIGWALLGVDAQAPALARLSPQEPVQVQASPVAESGVMLRDPRLDELMAAHKQFGGTSALQMPSGFLRNATFDGPAPRDAR